MNLIEFFGRLHPVMVHLPIGILLLALTLDGVEWKNPRFQSPLNIQFILWIGSGAAIFSVLSGYALSQNGDYPIDQLEQHKRLGYITSIFFLFYAAVRNWMVSKRIGHLTLTLCGILLLITTGHKGGSLTHGEGYLYALVEPNKDQKNSTATLTDEEVKSIEDAGWVIAPIAAGDGKLRIVGFNIEGSAQQALKQLSNFPDHIEELKLSYASITNADLQSIRSLSALKKIWLDHTRASDSCIALLLELEKLNYINLTSTSVTESGIIQLKQKKPRITIYPALLARKDSTTVFGTDSTSASD